jgi:hypothetical protein
MVRAARRPPIETASTPQGFVWNVSEIVAMDKLDEYVEVNEFQNRAYFSKPMIRFDYPMLSDQESDQVRAALRRKADPEALAEGTETQPPQVEGEKT